MRRTVLVRAAIAVVLLLAAGCGVAEEQLEAEYARGARAARDAAERLRDDAVEQARKAGYREGYELGFAEAKRVQEEVELEQQGANPLYSDPNWSDTEGQYDTGGSANTYGSECGDGYYENTAGNCVRRPTEQNEGNATARCRDGTYSYSQSRSGTCSGHGGVDEWDP